MSGILLVGLACHRPEGQRVEAPVRGAIIDDSVTEAPQREHSPPADVPAAVAAAWQRLPEGHGWPRPADFQRRWDEGTPPSMLLHCHRGVLRSMSTSTDVGPLVLAELESPRWSVIMDAHEGDTYALRSNAWEPRGELSGSTTKLTADGAQLECVGPVVERVQPTGLAHAAYLYAVTLTSPAEPIRVETGASLDDATRRRLDELAAAGWSEAAVRELLALAPPASSGSWNDALVWARSEGRDELAYEIHRRYRPVGRCSHDHRPLDTKRAHAEACKKAGKPMCHLALVAELLAYRVSRVSDLWIGGRPVSYKSNIDEIPPEVDVALFMLGMLVDYPAARETGTSALIAPRFLALALADSEHRDVVAAELERWLEDPPLDTWNRHRVALALFSLRNLAEPSIDAAEHAKRLAALPHIPDVTRIQLERVTP